MNFKGENESNILEYTGIVFILINMLDVVYKGTKQFLTGCWISQTVSKRWIKNNI